MKKKLQFLGTDVKFMRLDDKYDEFIEVISKYMGELELSKVIKYLGWKENDQFKFIMNDYENENFQHAHSSKNVSVATPLNSKTKLDLSKYY